MHKQVHAACFGRQYSSTDLFLMRLHISVRREADEKSHHLAKAICSISHRLRKNFAIVSCSKSVAEMCLGVESYLKDYGTGKHTQLSNRRE
eukprot:2977052-Karenia_brevis.AAC.1